jgi:hypothetical protein
MKRSIWDFEKLEPISPNSKIVFQNDLSSVSIGLFLLLFLQYSLLVWRKRMYGESLNDLPWQKVKTFF